MNKLLIIGGPTSTGKTSLGLELAQEYQGEIVSADSRQVYIGMDIVTGKDIPPHFRNQSSKLNFLNKEISYYTNGSERIWLTDLVLPNESFNVSFFFDAASRVIADIHARGKLPIVVGGTGLYIKSLTHNLSDILVPINSNLRSELNSKSADELLDQLKQLNPQKADSLNNSDRKNPRRLIRAIEIASSKNNTAPNHQPKFDICGLYLQGPQTVIYQRIDDRVIQRINAGAEREIKKLLSQGYTWNLPSMQTTGYKVWQPYFDGVYTINEVISSWQQGEHSDYRQQSVWFKNQFPYPMIDVSTVQWREKGRKLISDWYNKK